MSHNGFALYVCLQTMIVCSRNLQLSGKVHVRSRSAQSLIPLTVWHNSTLTPPRGSGQPSNSKLPTLFWMNDRQVKVPCNLEFHRQNSAPPPPKPATLPSIARPVKKNHYPDSGFGHKLRSREKKTVCTAFASVLGVTIIIYNKAFMHHVYIHTLRGRGFWETGETGITIIRRKWNTYMSWGFGEEGCLGGKWKKSWWYLRVMRCLNVRRCRWLMLTWRERTGRGWMSMNRVIGIGTRW